LSRVFNSSNVAKMLNEALPPIKKPLIKGVLL